MQSSKREALEQGKKTKKYGYSEWQFKIISGILRGRNNFACKITECVRALGFCHKYQTSSSFRNGQLNAEKQSARQHSKWSRVSTGYPLRPPNCTRSSSMKTSRPGLFRSRNNNNRIPFEDLMRLREMKLEKYRRRNISSEKDESFCGRRRCILMTTTRVQAY